MIYKKTISPEELKKKLDKNENLLIVDTRKDTRSLKSIDGAILIPSSELIDKQNALPKNKTIILYCSQGVESFFLMNILLADYDFAEVFSLKSGLEGWHKYLQNI